MTDNERRVLELLRDAGELRVCEIAARTGLAWEDSVAALVALHVAQYVCPLLGGAHCKWQIDTAGRKALKMVARERQPTDAELLDALDQWVHRFGPVHIGPHGEDVVPTLYPDADHSHGMHPGPLRAVLWCMHRAMDDSHGESEATG